MPSVHVTAYVQEQYNTVAKVTFDGQLVELPKAFDVENASAGELAQLRNLVRDRITSVEVELMRQLDLMLERARTRERQEADAKRQQAERDREDSDEGAAIAAAPDVPWEPAPSN